MLGIGNHLSGEAEIIVNISLILAMLILLLASPFLIIKLVRELKIKYKLKYYKKHNKVACPINHHDFVLYCDDLLKDNWFTDVRINEQYDIIAEKASVSFYIRCSVVYETIDDELMEEIIELKKQSNKCVGVLFADHNFSMSERKIAETYNITLWDEEFLCDLAENTTIETSNKVAWEKTVNE